MSNVMRNSPLRPSDKALENMATVKELGEKLHEFIETLPPGRGHSIAKTKLEEAVMWSVKQIAIQDEQDAA